tara:strand:- start:339 stop:536 length:198 start_codon:yes stop_codon:yes gene_type:complete
MTTIAFMKYSKLGIKDNIKFIKEALERESTNGKIRAAVISIDNMNIPVYQLLNILDELEYFNLNR